MKRLSRIFIIFLCGLFLTALVYIPLSSQRRFDNFCNKFFQEEMSANSLTLHYTVENPENYGISCEPPTLGNYAIPGFSHKRQLFFKYLSLQTISRRSLTKEQQITLDLLRRCLKTELQGTKYALLKEPLTPSIGIQSQLPVLLAEYTFHTPEDVEEYLVLLSCVPEYFDSLIALEERKCLEGLFMDKESAGELITYCTEFLGDRETHFLQETFSQRLSGLSLSKEQEAAYRKENTAMLENCVFPAYEKLKTFLVEKQDSGTNENGLYYYPEGTDYYEWLLRSEIGTDRTFTEIEELLEASLKKDAATIRQLVQKNPDLPEQRDNLSIKTVNPSSLTAYLAKRAEHDFPGIADVSVEICNVPPSMEPHLSPAFYLVPPIDNCSSNVVYLNNGYLNEGISFFTTLAHESYPGHLYQTVYENSTGSHPVHRLLYFGGYVEGWGTYAEQMSYNYAPISEDLAALLSSTRAMTLNLYSHLDLYVHAYGWTEKDCEEYLKKFGITASETIHNMFLLVKQQPANYLKYYLGYLELCELKAQAKDILKENFSSKEFHKFLLDYGPAPFDLLKKYMQQWLKETAPAPLSNA